MDPPRLKNSYHYTYETSGFIAPLELLVMVRSRAVSSTTVIAPPEHPGGAPGFTMEQLFDDIRQRLGGPCKTTVRYDQAGPSPISPRTRRSRKLPEELRDYL
jgi:Family of unknown function (DUF6174)